MELFYLIAALLVVATVLGLCAAVGSMKKDLDELREKFCDTNSRLSVKTVNIENQIDVLVKRIDEIPVEELKQQQEQEAAYLAGLQNIFNYGGEIPKLNMEAIRRE